MSQLQRNLLVRLATITASRNRDHRVREQACDAALFKNAMAARKTISQILADSQSRFMDGVLALSTKMNFFTRSRERVKKSTVGFFETAKRSRSIEKIALSVPNCDFLNAFLVVFSNRHFFTRSPVSLQRLRGVSQAFMVAAALVQAGRIWRRCARTSSSRRNNTGLS